MSNINLSAFKQLDKNKKGKLTSIINQHNRGFKNRPKIELLNAQTNPFTTPVSDLTIAEKANADLLIKKGVEKANAQKRKRMELLEEAISNLMKRPNVRTNAGTPKHSINIKDTINPLAMYLNRKVGGDIKLFADNEEIELGPPRAEYEMKLLNDYKDDVLKPYLMYDRHVDSQGHVKYLVNVDRSYANYLYHCKTLPKDIAKIQAEEWEDKIRTLNEIQERKKNEDNYGLISNIIEDSCTFITDLINNYEHDHSLRNINYLMELISKDINRIISELTVKFGNDLTPATLFKRELITLFSRLLYEFLEYVKNYAISKDPTGLNMYDKHDFNYSIRTLSKNYIQPGIEKINNINNVAELEAYYKSIMNIYTNNKYFYINQNEITDNDESTYVSSASSAIGDDYSDILEYESENERKSEEKDDDDDNIIYNIYNTLTNHARGIRYNADRDVVEPITSAQPFSPIRPTYLPRGPRGPIPTRPASPLNPFTNLGPPPQSRRPASPITVQSHPQPINPPPFYIPDQYQPPSPIQQYNQPPFQGQSTLQPPPPPPPLQPSYQPRGPLPPPPLPPSAYQPRGPPRPPPSILQTNTTPPPPTSNYFETSTSQNQPHESLNESNISQDNNDDESEINSIQNDINNLEENNYDNGNDDYDADDSFRPGYFDETINSDTNNSSIHKLINSEPNSEMNNSFFEEGESFVGNMHFSLIGKNPREAFDYILSTCIDIAKEQRKHEFKLTSEPTEEDLRTELFLFNEGPPNISANEMEPIDLLLTLNHIYWNICHLLHYNIFKYFHAIRLFPEIIKYFDNIINNKEFDDKVNNTGDEQLIYNIYPVVMTNFEELKRLLSLAQKQEQQQTVPITQSPERVAPPPPSSEDQNLINAIYEEDNLDEIEAEAQRPIKSIIENINKHISRILELTRDETPSVPQKYVTEAEKDANRFQSQFFTDNDGAEQATILFLLNLLFKNDIVLQTSKKILNEATIPYILYRLTLIEKYAETVFYNDYKREHTRELRSDDAANEKKKGFNNLHRIAFNIINRLERILLDKHPDTDNIYIFRYPECRPDPKDRFKLNPASVDLATKKLYSAYNDKTPWQSLSKIPDLDRSIFPPCIYIKHKDNTKLYNKKLNKKRIRFEEGWGKKGGDSDKAISNIDIFNFVEKKYHNYHGKWGGVGSYNEINQFPQWNKPKWGFILNTLSSNAPAKKIGHWVSVVIDNQNKCIMYYDSFGEEPPHLSYFKSHIQKLKQYPNQKYQFKINRVKNQRITSSNCGFFSMHFLDNILNKNKSFKNATDFNTLVGEKKMELLRKEFEYI